MDCKAYLKGLEYLDKKKCPQNAWYLRDRKHLITECKNWFPSCHCEFCNDSLRKCFSLRLYSKSPR